MPDMKICVSGASGRMGAALIRAISQADGLVLTSALERKGAESVGQDAGLRAGLPQAGIVITDNADEALEGVDGIVDFTRPDASVELAEKAARRQLVHVIGTTGCTQKDERALQDCARDGAILIKSGNMSAGVNLLAWLVKKTASMLGDEFDIEIVEMHHNRKVDAPSGTALLLGEAAAKGRDIPFRENAVFSRQGITGIRKKGTIGFATLRGGSVVGEHSVILAGPGERIELTHRAQDRSLFANGAVRALLWGRGKKAGYYSMTDVLELKD